MVNKLIMIVVILVAGWYGSSLYRQNDLSFIQNFITNFVPGKEVKCITKDGRVLYGSVPQGIKCERLESVEGSLTIVPSESSSTNKGNNHKDSRFQCDGRRHCSQMTSKAEAEYFLTNCPNTKMDGDYDGIPCEDYF
jgi:hypothetical protein